MTGRNIVQSSEQSLSRWAEIKVFVLLLWLTLMGRRHGVDRVLLSSPNCSGSHCVAQVDLKPDGFFLSLPSEFWDYKCALLN